MRFHSPFCRYNFKSADGDSDSIVKRSPWNVHEPNFSEQFCLSNGKLATLILQVLVKDAGAFHSFVPSSDKITAVLYFSSPPPLLSSALKIKLCVRKVTTFHLKHFPQIGITNIEGKVCLFMN